MTDRSFFVMPTTLIPPTPDKRETTAFFSSSVHDRIDSSTYSGRPGSNGYRQAFCSLKFLKYPRSVTSILSVSFALVHLKRCFPLPSVQCRLTPEVSVLGGQTLGTGH